MRAASQMERGRCNWIRDQSKGQKNAGVKPWLYDTLWLYDQIALAEYELGMERTYTDSHRYVIYYMSINWPHENRSVLGLVQQRSSFKQLLTCWTSAPLSSHFDMSVFHLFYLFGYVWQWCISSMAIQLNWKTRISYLLVNLGKSEDAFWLTRWKCSRAPLRS